MVFKTAVLFGLSQKCQIKLPSSAPVDSSQAGGVNPIELSRFVPSVKRAIDEPEFAETIENLKKNREDWDNLIAVTSGMKDDPLAIAII